MFSQIVVPLDGTPLAARALAPAFELARVTGARLTAVSYVLDDGPLTARAELVRGQLRAAGADTAGLQVERIPGAVAPAVAAAAAAGGSSVVVMSTLGHPRTAPIVGSVSEEVLAAVEGPVVLVGPHVDLDAVHLAGAILVGMDGSGASDSVLLAVAPWVAGLGLEPWVVTVIDRTRRAGLLREAVSGTGQGDESSRIRTVARRLEDLVGREVRFEVLHGEEPALALAREARTRRAALLALATRCRSGAERVALGSVAISAVHHAPCPVLLHPARADR